MRGVRLAAVAVAALGVAASSGCGGDEPSQGAEPTMNLSDQELVVAAAGDFGLRSPRVATLESMGAADPDLVLGLGDLSYAGPGSEDEFCGLVDSAIGSGTPFELISGNHEEDTGEDGRIKNFARCLPDRLGAVGEYGAQYYFDAGRLARFIMISPDLTIEDDYHYYGPDDDGSDTPDLAWLRESIDEAKAEGIEWIVVGMHKNCISVGEYYCDVYQDLFSSLIEKRVDLVLTGHDHTYQRSKQINAPRDGCPAVIVDRFDPDCVVDGGDTYERGAGTAFVVAGAGGAELYPVHPDDPEADYFAASMGVNSVGNRHGFAKLTISPERLGVQFVGSTPGSFADRFAIVAP